MTGTLLSVCAVHELRRDSGWVGITGIDKRPQRPGPYLRVVRAGVVAAGDPIEVVARPAGAPTVREVFARG